MLDDNLRAMRLIPTARIEAMIGLEPLEVTSKENAIAASKRINMIEVGKRSRR